MARLVECLVNEDGRFVVELPQDDLYTSIKVDELGLDVAALRSTVDARLGLP